MAVPLRGGGWRAINKITYLFAASLKYPDNFNNKKIMFIQNYHLKCWEDGYLKKHISWDAHTLYNLFLLAGCFY